MGCRYCLYWAVMVVMLVAGPAFAAAQQPVDEDQALMDLYFDNDEMVEVVTGAPKPMLQVAENVTIIDRQDISAMHAHTLYEALARVSGLFVDYFGQDFGSSASFGALATRSRHTLVLLDGMRINGASGGVGIINFIPVDIVKRIEVIKGPASSTWGSALGGVVNIITEDTGNSAQPEVNLAATYGQAVSRELSGNVAGKVHAFSYFLHAGNMDSDGLVDDRFFARDSLYAKGQYRFATGTTLTVAGGVSDPYYKSGELKSLDVKETVRNRNHWGTIYLDHRLWEGLNLHLSLQRYERDFYDEQRVLGLGIKAGGANALFNSTDWDEQTTTVSSRLDYGRRNLQVTVGAEASRSLLDYYLAYGPQWGGPASEDPAPAREERRGLYANGTLSFGKLTLSPGLRYDDHSITEEFISPSLGATYQLAADTLLRAGVSKGFSAPYLAMTSTVGGQWAWSSPGLRPEEILSCQAGVETNRFFSSTIKATLFHQQIDEVWTRNWSNSTWENQGRNRIVGADLELVTRPWRNLQLTANGTSTFSDTEAVENDPMYGASLVVDYDDNHAFKGQLAGRYHWYNAYSKGERPQGGNIVWDACLSRMFLIKGVASEMFVKVHNLANASHYSDYEYPNPGRWFEAGITLGF